MKNSILVAILLAFSPHSFAGLIAGFSQQIEERCSEANSVLIKKVLIEIIRDSEGFCTRPFSARLIKSCPELSCNELIETYYKIKEEQGGNIVGN